MECEIKHENDSSQVTENESNLQIAKKLSQSKHGRKKMIKHEEQTAGLPYMCTICRKTFKTPSHRVIHMRTHSGEKPYICNICEKGFTNSSHLTRHMRTHSGEKPYPCNICEKEFSQQSNLHKHMKTHSGKKPFNIKTYKSH